MARRRTIRALAGTGLALALLVACSPGSPEPTPTTPTITRTPSPTPSRERPPPPEPALGAWGVSSGHPAAAEAGSAMLAAGGNAVDAAVAAALAVSVVEPFASGIGGGGAAVVVPPGGEPVAYDFREVVPAGGVAADGVGVPGLLAGLGLLHDEHGALPWADVVAPAVGLARDGHPVSGMLADQLRSGRGVSAASGLPQFFPGGTPLAEGEVLVQEALADTLAAVADGGPEVFYRGELGRSLSAAVPAVDQASLESYTVQRSAPPSGAFAGYELVTASPPLPGVALIQMLQIAEALGLEEAPPGSADHAERLALAWARAAESVDTVLGDPAFVEVPVAELTDAQTNAALAVEIADARLTGAPVHSATETTHTSVVDDDGGAVSMTTTLTHFWGSGRSVDGYFLNDQMVRFAVGAGGSNTPEPGRRSVSWSLPAVVLDAGRRPVLVLGSPGGQRIPMILGNVLTRWAVHGEDLADAVAAPRFHVAGRELEVEQLPSAAVAAELRERGWSLRGPFARETWVFGSVQALEVDWEERAVIGAVDGRREAGLATSP